jgi:uncharacterized protein (DUF1501 family)
MCDDHKGGHIHASRPKNDTKHNEEHKTWNRRSFLQALGLVGGGTIAFANNALTINKPSPLGMALTQSDNENILVIVRLKGGNDGLNTVIPMYDYDTYASARPFIKINEQDTFALNADFAMPNYMNPLESVWGDGKMKVVHGVGYNDQSLSHFTSSDIWASTDATNQEDTGWMGRYFEDLYPDYLFNPPASPPAIQIGSAGNLIFDGSDLNYSFAVSNPQTLFSIAENGTVYDVNNLPDCTHGDKLGFLRGLVNTTYNYAGVINEAYENSTEQVDYGTSSLGQQLSLVSRLIKGNLGTKIYMVTLDGFDTHSNQAEKHELLMTTLSETMAAFYQDLGQAGWDDKVLGMTISEFGRRPYENGSKGTDHGAASTMLMFGPALNGNGFQGAHPDLSDVDARGNLKFDVDYRSVYTSILTDWLCIDAPLVNLIMLGQEYPTLDLGFNCSSLSIDDFNGAGPGVVHAAYYKEQDTFIHFTNPSAAHVVVKLYNLLGQEIGTVKNEMLFSGTHHFDVKRSMNTHLQSGQYIYRIAVGGKFYSKSLLIL